MTICEILLANIAYRPERGGSSLHDYITMEEENMLSGIQRMSVAVVIAAAILSATAEAQTEGQWIKLAPLPVPSEEYTFTSANGKIYLLGGNSIPGKVSPGLVQEYDSVTDKWTKKKDMPIRANHMAAAEYHGKIYVFGGQEILPGGRDQDQ